MPSVFRPIFRSSFRPIFRPLFGGGGGPVDPWAGITPVLRLESDYGILKTGGDPAGFLDLVNTITNRGTASDATQATSGSQGFYLPLLDDAGYYFSPAITGNYASAPPTGLSGLQVIDIKAKITPSSFSGFFHIAAKRGGSGLDWGFRIQFASLYLYGFESGVEVGAGGPALPYSPFDTFWVRGLINAAEGELSFYTSDDGITWTQLGSTASVTPWVNDSSAQPVTFGALGDGSEGMRGAIHYASVDDGENPNLAIDFTDPAIADNALSFEASTGQTVTVNQSGSNPAKLVRYEKVRSDGVDDSYEGTADHDIASDIAITVYSDLPSGDRGVRRTLVSASNIISNTGNDWVILDGVDVDFEVCTVLPSSTPESRIIGIENYYASKLDVPIL